MKVSVLGTEYKIEYHSRETDKRLESYDGYCDFYSKLIVISEKDADADIHDYAAYQRKCLRHEIVHAFLYESGLAHSSQSCYGAWAVNEEMVDFIAIQGEKIRAAWAEVNALD